MRRILGYDRQKLSVPLTPGAYLVVPAPLGAVENLEDAERLVAELRHVFPGRRFDVVSQPFDALAFLMARGSHETHQVALVA